jgi:hypothetical protein
VCLALGIAFGSVGSSKPQTIDSGDLKNEVLWNDHVEEAARTSIGPPQDSVRT